MAAATKQKTIRQVEVLARMHTASAIDTLAEIMEDPGKPAAARVAAANSLLDRGWGRTASLIAPPADEEDLTDAELYSAIRLRLTEISREVGSGAREAASGGEEETDTEEC